jgi:hypoxanthine phosphoribosyltransferase
VHYLMENLGTRRPASIKLCALLHKPERAERAVDIHYLGFTIPNKFVVGYGLDVNERFRNLREIGVVAAPEF